MISPHLVFLYHLVRKLRDYAPLKVFPMHNLSVLSRAPGHFSFLRGTSNRLLPPNRLLRKHRESLPQTSKEHNSRCFFPNPPPLSYRHRQETAPYPRGVPSLHTKPQFLLVQAFCG